MLCPNIFIKCKVICSPADEESLFFIHLFIYFWKVREMPPIDRCAPLHWSELTWQVQWQSHLNAIIKRNMPPLRELCEVIILNVAARWRHHGSGEDTLGYSQSLRRQQACCICVVLIGNMWRCAISVLYLHHHNKKIILCSKGFSSVATGTTTVVLFTWQPSICVPVSLPGPPCAIALCGLNAYNI